MVVYRHYVLWKWTVFSLFCIWDLRETIQIRSRRCSCTACCALWMVYSKFVLFRLGNVFYKWLFTFFSYFNRKKISYLCCSFYLNFNGSPTASEWLGKHTNDSWNRETFAVSSFIYEIPLLIGGPLISLEPQSM